MKLDKRNYRKHSDKNKRIIEKSLKEFGAGRSILIDNQDEIIAGNGVFEQAEKLNIPIRIIETNGTELIAVKRTDLATDDEKRKQLALIDNHSSDTSEFDKQLIEEDFTSDFLSEWEFDIPETIEEAEEDNFIPGENIETDIVEGDLFKIGEHYLLCGDSFNSDHLSKLMQGAKARFMFTDPPYDLEKEEYASNILLFTENAHIFVMHDDRGIVEYLRNSSLTFKQFFVADFQFSSPRGNDPYLSHILISHEVNGDAVPHKNMYDGIRSIMKLEYRHRNKEENFGHKHQKPVDFIGNFINHYSDKGDKCLDLFGGSGSTMAACEQLKRNCYMMELEPKNCQIILDRMKSVYNLDAIKI